MKKIALSLFAASVLGGCTISNKDISTNTSGQISQNRNITQEETNRKLVVAFYESVFVNKQPETARNFIGDTYIQHNPQVANGREALIEGLSSRIKAQPERSNRILRTAADGDLVWLHLLTKSDKNDRGRVVVDIFRVEKGKIVEHWDVMQAIPESSANGNTMY